MVGGQTTFDPIRPNDVHLVQLSENSVDIVKSGDVTDDIDVQSVDVTADCSYALYGNRSPFTDTFGRLSLVDLTGTDIELADSIDTDEDISMKYLLISTFSVSSLIRKWPPIELTRPNRATRFHNRIGLVANFSELPDGDLSHIIIASVHDQVASERRPLVKMDSSRHPHGRRLEGAENIQRDVRLGWLQ